MSSPQTPSETYEALYSGSVNLAAVTFISGISWGVMTSLYLVCMCHLLRNLCSAATTRKTAFAIWITILWILSSLSTIANAYYGIYAYSWKMDYPGGPAAYLDDSWNKPVPMLGYAAYILTMWFADALMLWRLVMFYHDVRPVIRGSILSFAFLLYVGVVGSGCFMMIVLGTNQTMDSERAMNAGILMFTLSVALNVFVTAVIVIRLLCFRKLLERVLERGEVLRSPYTSVAAMLTESSALYAIWSLVFIILYGTNNPVQNVLLGTLCSVQVIAPVLIAYRVSKGASWDHTISTRLTSKQLIFAGGEGTSMICTSEREVASAPHA